MIDVDSMFVAMTVAGSDPSGGAGIQADLKTFHQMRVYGAAAVTLLTVQNTRGVSRVECLAPDLVREQIEYVLDDLPVRVLKYGALGNESIIEMLGGLSTSRAWPETVMDPVMISKHGVPLLPESAVRSLCTKLLPTVALLTPNAHEAAALLQRDPLRDEADMRDAAQKLSRMGPDAVLVKGGHVDTDNTAIDVLWHRGETTVYRSARTSTQHTHGTGCTYSAAITALRARGVAWSDAIRTAKTFITHAIETAPGLGSGQGPVNHWASSV